MNLGVFEWKIGKTAAIDIQVEQDNLRCSKDVFKRNSSWKSFEGYWFCKFSTTFSFNHLKFLITSSRYSTDWTFSSYIQGKQWEKKSFFLMKSRQFDVLNQRMLQKRLIFYCNKISDWIQVKTLRIYCLKGIYCLKRKKMEFSIFRIRHRWFKVVWQDIDDSKQSEFIMSLIAYNWP